MFVQIEFSIALDKDNNGKILEAELRQILGNLGDNLSNQEVTVKLFCVSNYFR